MDFEVNMSSMKDFIFSICLNKEKAMMCDTIMNARENFFRESANVVSYFSYLF